MSLNVNRSITDQFYRYKMPRILAKVEGKGNGIKTVIANMPEVSKALCRPPTYPCKFFGCELGAQTQFDFKNERYIVNGSHDPAKLQDLLDIFIRKFVLCPECDNPETHLRVKKTQIGQHCAACGYQGMLDMRHKLTTYILKNPPEINPAQSGASKTGRKMKRSQQKQHQNGEGDADQDDDDLPDDDDLDWSVDTSESAVKERMQNLTSGAKVLTLNDDLEKTPQERLDIFFRFVKKKKEDNALANCDKDICAEADRLDVKEKAPLILAEILLDENILKQLKQYKLHFLRLTHDSPKAQKYLLGGFEQLCGLYQDTLMPKVPVILKAMYDLDFLEEEVILAWAKKPSKKYVSKETNELIHEKASPFVKWLAEAEEEESSEDEEVEVSFSNRSGGGGLKVETVAPAKGTTSPTKPAEEKKAEEDDFDIDDI